MLPRMILIPLAATALALAACGDDETTSAGTSGATEAADAGRFPVEVPQALGTVTIDEPPERVVALDYPSADAALALGVVPVGMYEVSYVDGGVQEWTEAALDELGGERPELIDTEKGFPLETIQRLRPDVILATNTYPLIEESWDDLNAIAPVVGHVKGPGVDDWRDGVRQVARALGREDDGDQLIADVDERVEQASADHPGLKGKTVSIFNYVDGDGLYVINADDDASLRFFEQLGLAGLTDRVAALEGEEGRAKVSPESYRTIDADVVVGTSPDPAALERLERDKLFSKLPAVERGSFVGLDIGQGTALAFPSALSVPYAIEELVGPVAEAASASGS
jgi:ABC-type Fe3+-hydroxamate transport system substrate-binding protein